MQPWPAAAQHPQWGFKVPTTPVTLTHTQAGCTARPSSQVQAPRTFLNYWLGPKGFAYMHRYPTCSEPRIHRSNQVTLRCCDERASSPKTGQHFSHLSRFFELFLDHTRFLTIRALFMAEQTLGGTNSGRNLPPALRPASPRGGWFRLTSTAV
jgi:hypothetical protein